MWPGARGVPRHGQPDPEWTGPALRDQDSRTRAQAAAELGYQPSSAGRTLAKGSSDIVIAVIPNMMFGGNLQDIFQNATEELAARGLTLLLHLATATN